MLDLLSEIVEDDDDEGILLRLFVEVKMKTVKMRSKWIPRLLINYNIMISYIHKQLKEFILFMSIKNRQPKEEVKKQKSPEKHILYF
jgi:hypothetical protein